jgi:hypothetical protein
LRASKKKLSKQGMAKRRAENQSDSKHLFSQYGPSLEGAADQRDSKQKEVEEGAENQRVSKREADWEIPNESRNLFPAWQIFVRGWCVADGENIRKSRVRRVEDKFAKMPHLFRRQFLNGSENILPHDNRDRSQHFCEIRNDRIT